MGIFRLVCLMVPLLLFLVPSPCFSPCFSADDKNYSHKIEREIVDYLKAEKVQLSEVRLRAIARHVLYESKRHDVDYRLVLALMKVESNFKHNAVSPKGARGLLQIKPVLGKTVARNMGLELKRDADLHEPEKNITIGVHHLSQLIESFDSLSSALYAYNKGETRVRAEKIKKIKPNPRFTNAVMKEYSKNLALLPGD